MAAPYVGLVVDYGPVKIGALASPRVFGSLRATQTLNYAAIPGFPAGATYDDMTGGFSNGYFGELFGEWITSFAQGTATLYAKYNYIHGTGTLAWSQDSAVVGMGGTYAAGLTRENFVMGGNFAVHFNAPF